MLYKDLKHYKLEKNSLVTKLSLCKWKEKVTPSKGTACSKAAICLDSKILSEPFVSGTWKRGFNLVLVNLCRQVTDHAVGLNLS